MGCSSRTISLMTKGMLCCPSDIIQTIVHPLDICIQSSDICLAFEKPLDEVINIDNIPELNIDIIETDYNLLIENIDNPKLNIDKCQE